VSVKMAQFIWRRCRQTTWGRLVARLLIDGVFGLSASVSASHDATTIIICSAAASLIGGIASLFLESRDRRREASPEWQQRINKAEHELQQTHPALPPVVARAAAVSGERQRFTPLVWIGLAVGIFCALCGLLMFVLKIVRLFRT
jgi:membrane protein YqaA with SNARE-associated domain